MFGIEAQDLAFFVPTKMSQEDTETELLQFPKKLEHF